MAHLCWLGRQIVKCRLLVGRMVDASWNQVREAGRRAQAKTRELLVAGGSLLLRTRRLIGPVLAASALGGLTGVAACSLDPWITGAVSAVGGLTLALGLPTGSAWLPRAWQME